MRYKYVICIISVISGLVCYECVISGYTCVISVLYVCDKWL